MKAGLKNAEDELNLIKNQIQQTLLDIREHILDVTNPFNDPASLFTGPDETDVAEELMDTGGGGDSPSDAGGGGDGGAEETVEDEDSDDLLGEDDDLPMEEYDSLPGDDLVSDASGGGGLSDFMAPEEMLDDAEPEDFEFDDVEEIPQEEFVEEQEEEETPLAAEEVDEPVEPARPSKKSGASPNMAQLDLVTLASLVRWVSTTSRRLGHNRMAVLLDTYEMAGRISPQVRAVIGNLSLLDDEDPDDAVPVRDIIAAMVRMEGVLNVSDSTESNRLIGLLLDMEEDPLDRLLLS